MLKHVAEFESRVFCDPRTSTLLVALLDAIFVLHKTDDNESNRSRVGLQVIKPNGKIRVRACVVQATS